MKTLLLILAVMGVNADVIPPGSHYVTRRVTVTNADSLGGVVLIGYCKFLSNSSRSVIRQDSALMQCYKFASYYIFWSYRDTVAARTLDSLDFDGVINGVNTQAPLFLITDKINPYGIIVEDANPLIAEEDYYRLCDGFQLALWKKVSKFNDGSPDLTETFPIAAEKAVKSAAARVELSFTETSLIYRLPSAEPVKLEFYDPSGKLAARLAGSGRENRVALPKLATGNYIVKLKSAHYSASSTVAIKR